ncbi:hypothetical protein CIG75_09870 [Tumebacillus algifaecis]|uniref:6-phosphogluconate dehydrogenase n=1 Tax=Tumebacillus algifaecis TaxID=1214604 RepID=A0A223D136_9BACL|nr:NAD(P)-dependent oxidoreductase [Tumebacillus algifaecis]ASS75261.1 hypothetical protein CIG75_09870 [Tumebacillus algifaecis]
MVKRIGWIGTGVLGSAVVARLLERGYEVVVYNRTVQKAEQLGVAVASSPRELAETCDLLFLCVKGQDAAESLLFDPERGVVASGRKGLCVIDMSTVAPEFAVSLHQRLEAAGLDYLEVPVSGGREGGRKGTLGALVAGREEVFAQQRDVLGELTSKLLYVGEGGKAQLLKVLNNLAESIHMLAAAEVAAIGKQAGLDLTLMHEALSSMRGYSTYMGVLFERLINPSDVVSTSLAVRIKDLDLAHSLADQFDVSIPMGALAEQLFKLAAQQQGAARDQTECVKLLLP